MDQLRARNSEKIVVIVEDEFLVRDLAVCELEDNGYTVVEFDTADAALPYLRQHGGRTAALVTDVQMPGTLDGLQLTDIVSLIWPDIPVLVTSGGSLVDPARLPHCAKFLRKPWRPAEMMDRIRSMLRGATFQSLPPSPSPTVTSAARSRPASANS